MKIPLNGSDNINSLAHSQGDIFSPPYVGKEALSFFEAIDTINTLSAQIMADYALKGDRHVRRTL